MNEVTCRASRVFESIGVSVERLHHCIQPQRCAATTARSGSEKERERDINGDKLGRRQRGELHPHLSP